VLQLARQNGKESVASPDQRGPLKLGQSAEIYTNELFSEIHLMPPIWILMVRMTVSFKPVGCAPSRQFAAPKGSGDRGSEKDLECLSSGGATKSRAVEASSRPILRQSH
jgi:hypothetical protein